MVQTEVGQLKVCAAELDGRFLPIVSSGNGVVGSLSTARRCFAVLCAMILAPASLNGLPPAMWSSGGGCRSGT